MKNVLPALNLLLIIFLCFSTPTVKALTVNEPISLEICVPNEKTALKLTDIIFEDAYPGSINDNLYKSNVRYLKEKDVWSVTYKLRNSNNQFPETCIINISRLDAEITFENIERSIICIPNEETALKVGEIIIKALFPNYNYEAYELTASYFPKNEVRLENEAWLVEYVPIQPTSTDPNYMPFVEGGGPAVFLQKENTKLIFSTIFR